MITGFGPFEEVLENPAGRLALRLEAHPPAGWAVRARELPVSFRRGPMALDELLDGLSAHPDLLLALGAHEDPGFRLERGARGSATGRPGRTDVDGVPATELPGEPGDYRSSLPVDQLASALRERTGVAAWVSDDAGGYVCERVYHRLLRRGKKEGTPALFMHVPPFEHASPERQERVLHALLSDLGARL